MNEKEIINKLIAKKAEENNTIDLNIYEQGLIDMWNLLSISDALLESQIISENEHQEKDSCEGCKHEDKSIMDEPCFKCNDLECYESD